MLFLAEMSKYVTRACPKCGDFFGVVLGNQLPETKVFPIRGWCMHCGYKIEWKLVIGGVPRRQRRKYGSLQTDPATVI
jgi:uncharacterized OB-fold protein